MKAPEKIYINKYSIVLSDGDSERRIDENDVEYTRSDKVAEASKEMTKAFVEFCTEMTMAKNVLSKFNEVYEDFINSRKK